MSTSSTGAIPSSVSCPAALGVAASPAPSSSSVVSPISPSIVQLWGGIPAEKLRSLVERAQASDLDESGRKAAIQALGTAILDVEKDRKALALIGQKQVLDFQKGTAVSMAGTNQPCVTAITALAQTALDIQAINGALLAQRTQLVQTLTDLADKNVATPATCLSIIQSLGEIAKDIAAARDTLVRQKEAELASEQTSQTASSPTKSYSDSDSDRKLQMRMAFLLKKTFVNLEQFSNLPVVKGEFDALLLSQKPPEETEIEALQTRWQSQLTATQTEMVEASQKASTLAGRYDALMSLFNERVIANWQINNWMMPLLSLRLLHTQALRLSQEVTSSLTADSLASLQARATALKQSFEQQQAEIPEPDLRGCYTFGDALRTPATAEAAPPQFDNLKSSKMLEALGGKRTQLMSVASQLRKELTAALTQVQDALLTFPLKQDIEALRVKIVATKKVGPLSVDEIAALKIQLKGRAETPDSFEKEYVRLLEQRKQINTQPPANRPAEWPAIEAQLKEVGVLLNFLLNSIDQKEFKPDTEATLRGNWAGWKQLHTRYTAKWYESYNYTDYTDYAAPGAAEAAAVLQ